MIESEQDIQMINDYQYENVLKFPVGLINKIRVKLNVARVELID